MRSNDSQKIIAVGIPKSMDDAGLSELFSGFGTVAEAKVVLDANTNASRGFGFVTFTASSAMRAAVKGMNKKPVDGRVLNVRQLVPKDQFQQQKQSDESAAADPSKRPCWLLRKGKCTKGDSCPFSHETQDGEFGSCFEFAQTGACKRGDKCKFYHPPASEDAEGGDKTASVAAADDKKKGKTGDKSKPKADDKPKKRVCYAFQSGRCHRGKTCLFVHEKLPAEVSEPKQEKKKAAAPVKKAGDFEVVAGDAGRKRTRDEMEGAPVDDSETESENGSEDVVMKQEAPQKPVKPAPKPVKQQPKPVKQQPKPVKSASKAAPAVYAKPNATKEKTAPLAGLAAHVSSFMKQQPAEKKAEKKVVEQPRRREAPAPSAKRQKTERVDMGAAFDGLSDDEEPRAGGKRGRKPADKAALKAAREKAKEDRRAKRSAKKTALSRLRTQDKVDFEADA